MMMLELRYLACVLFFLSGGLVHSAFLGGGSVARSLDSESFYFLLLHWRLII